MDRDRVDEKLERLADAGLSIVLDDFGTGFSTLVSLKDSRIRKIKIDKDFVRDPPAPSKIRPWSSQSSISGERWE